LQSLANSAGALQYSLWSDLVFSTVSSLLLQAILFYGCVDVVHETKSLCRTEERENVKNSPVGEKQVIEKVTSRSVNDDACVICDAVVQIISQIANSNVLFSSSFERENAF